MAKPLFSIKQAEVPKVTVCCSTMIGKLTILSFVQVQTVATFSSRFQKPRQTLFATVVAGLNRDLDGGGVNGELIRHPTLITFRLTAHCAHSLVTQPHKEVHETCRRGMMALAGYSSYQSRASNNETVRTGPSLMLGICLQ
jgi:hypothetical protein